MAKPKPLLNIYSDEDGNLYAHIAIIPGFQMQVELEESDLLRLADEIKNELHSIAEMSR